MASKLRPGGRRVPRGAELNSLPNKCALRAAPTSSPEEVGTRDMECREVRGRVPVTRAMSMFISSDVSDLEGCSGCCRSG